MTSSLVGSEMCIRDSTISDSSGRSRSKIRHPPSRGLHLAALAGGATVSYTHLTLPTICSV
eukprot:6999611-Prorocentrum_lima.AAC.1